MFFLFIKVTSIISFSNLHRVGTQTIYKRNISHRYPTIRMIRESFLGGVELRFHIMCSFPPFKGTVVQTISQRSLSLKEIPIKSRFHRGATIGV